MSVLTVSVRLSWFNQGKTNSFDIADICVVIIVLMYADNAEHFSGHFVTWNRLTFVIDQSGLIC